MTEADKLEEFCRNRKLDIALPHAIMDCLKPLGKISCGLCIIFSDLAVNKGVFVKSS